MSTLAESDSTSIHPINNLAILTKAIDQHSGDARRRGGRRRQVAGDLDGGGGGQRGKQSLAQCCLSVVVEFAGNPAAASIVVGRSFRPLCRIALSALPMYPLT